jgi:hypothetical protein
MMRENKILSVSKTEEIRFDTVVMMYYTRVTIKKQYLV